MTIAHPPRRDAQEQARLDAELTELVEHRITFNELLGLKVKQLMLTKVRTLYWSPSSFHCCHMELIPATCVSRRSSSSWHSQAVP